DPAGGFRRIRRALCHKRLDDRDDGRPEAGRAGEENPGCRTGRGRGRLGALLGGRGRLRDPASVRQTFPPRTRHRQGADAGDRAGGDRRPQTLRLHDAPYLAQRASVLESRVPARDPAPEPLQPDGHDLLRQVPTNFVAARPVRFQTTRQSCYTALLALFIDPRLEVPACPERPCLKRFGTRTSSGKSRTARPCCISTDTWFTRSR